MPSNKPTTQNVLIERVPVDVLRVIAAQAKREQRSRAAMIRYILEGYARGIASEGK